MNWQHSLLWFLYLWCAATIKEKERDQEWRHKGLHPYIPILTVQTLLHFLYGEMNRKDIPLSVYWEYWSYNSLIYSRKCKSSLWTIKKGSPVHQSSRIHRVWESHHFGASYAALPCFLHKRLFPGLEPVTFQSRDNNFAVAPRLPLINLKYYMI